jgi:hypothetical protein
MPRDAANAAKPTGPNRWAFLMQKEPFPAKRVLLSEAQRS